MSDFTQWKPNDRLQMLAEALRSTTKFLNNVKVPSTVPLIGGTGLGDVTTGTSGNLFEHMAYGDPILNHNANEGMFKDPQAVVDTAFLPGIGSVVGALRKGSQASVNMGLDMGRRAAMGNLGKAAALAGTTTIAPTMALDALKGLEKVVGKEAVPIVAKTITKFSPFRLGLGHSLASVANDFGGEIPVHFDEIIKQAKLQVPHLSDEQAAQAIERLADLHGASGILNVPDSLAKQVFEGRLTREDIHKLDFNTIEKQGNFALGDYNKLYQGMAGHAEVEDLAKHYNKPEPALKHIEDLREAAKLADYPDIIPLDAEQRIVDFFKNSPKVESKVESLGGAAKSAALIALLRGKSDLMLSRGAAGTHLLNVAGEELNPSFGIAKNKLMGTFGDTVLVPKHGKFDPSTGASKLYAEDAFTSEHGIPSSTYATPPTFSSFEEFTNNAKGANRLTTRNITASDMPKELKPKFDQFSKSVGLDPNDFESMLYVLRTMHPEDVTAAPKYIKTLHDYTMNLSPVSYAELKVKGPVKLSPENYAGVIHSGTDQNVATALANLVRQRGVPFHQMSEPDASIANMMQIIAGE